MFGSFGNKKLFYIIDDDEDLTFIMQKELEAKFYCNVRTFINLKGAVAELKTSTPDFIISDIKMPGENGLNLGKHLKGLAKMIPVIYITALKDPEDVTDEVTIISKPINFERLFKMIKFNLGDFEH